ncbi:transporter substrate-binding domain-containing protein [Halomonas sp. MCCC 1A11036]|uniref:Transporter substrate-binding domain-containing protein n=1 Tax=Billgrantia zhangzhouensis TaxID=2733481 RepID=A0ABS9AEI4_9GAMM|nr:transporter substrate-binding domain-containing protein [Halomonas zhangzhouensis]MCE8020141.1 transporter substrate-binding domain-containing protein [Halomonas zhangzhouensis]
MNKTLRSLFATTFSTALATTATLAVVATATLLPVSEARAEQETLTYAMTGLYPPFSYRENGELTGFDVDIGRALAEEMGMTAEPVANPWQTLIAALRSNRFDAIIGSMAITEARQEQVDFTDPYYSSGAQVFISANNGELHEVEDIRGKTLGVLVASSFADAAREHSDDLTTYTDDVTALRDLTVRGRVDAVITDQLIGENAIHNADLPVQPLGEPIYVDDIGIAVNKGNEELLERLNEALAAIKANGRYAEISERYFGRDISQ